MDQQEATWLLGELEVSRRRSRRNRKKRKKRFVPVMWVSPDFIAQA